MTDERLKERIYSVDLLRGVVMMIMLLDHTRDFVHSTALTYDPTDLGTTTVPLFFTRWITHFCAPAFVFLSGVSIYLQRMSGKSNPELSRFLLTRGLWLIVLEFTVIRTLVLFNFDYSIFGFPQVIWVIGVSMIAMATIIYLPIWVSGVFGVAMIALHNLLDVYQISPGEAFSGAADLKQSLWLIFHQQGVVPFIGGSTLVILYPLIPWIGVMAAGWAFGAIYKWDPERRRKFLLAVGLGSTVLFVAIRFINVYGDPSPWSIQPSTSFTILSFLNTTKYPPSLLFLLMTLGPSIFVLGLTDRIDGKAVWQRIAITYGRVPLFFYILQWLVAHCFGIGLSLAAGKDIGHFFAPPIPGSPVPSDYGFSLGVVYVAWIVGLILLYPLCYWYGNFKRRNKQWLLSYL